jgi:predicted nucleic acid-binding Zn ribbon protein
MGYIYETKTVRSNRKSKSCEICGKSMPVGASSVTATCFEDEFYSVFLCEKTECYSQLKNRVEKGFDEEEEMQMNDPEGVWIVPKNDCFVCGKTYEIPELVRILGKESSVINSGTCSAYCYTKKVTGHLSE